MLDLLRFLPMTVREMEARGWRELDVLLITGDAYFDHPSHGAAVIGRVLEKAGYRVGIIARPNWRSIDDFKQLGRPLLFVGVTGGAVDSIVSNYTASGAKRRNDVYSPGGAGGGRPDYAALVYAARAREAFPGIPIVLGGIEATCRRFAFFDSLKSKVRRSILLDSRADLLVYGQGEYQVLEVALRLAGGQNLEGIPGTAGMVQDLGSIRGDAVELPSFESISNDSKMLLAQSLKMEESGRPFYSRQMWQRYEEGIVLAEPPPVIDQETLDDFFDTAYCGEQHQSYRENIPALASIRWSLISHRGCPGGCTFCALAIHQGRRVVARSSDSVIEEAKRLFGSKGFTGTITDVGGPTANAYSAHSNCVEACIKCSRSSCFFPKICVHIETSHEKLLALLDRLASTPKAKRVLLASGVRHDLALKDPAFIKAIAASHTGGHLKAAPEHVFNDVLKHMRKPDIEIFEEFEKQFRNAGLAAGKKQYIVPYIIAGFPGCAPHMADAAARWLRSRRQRLEQVQIFMPLAGTVASAMYYAGVDTKGNRIFISDKKEQKRQKKQLTSPDTKL